MRLVSSFSICSKYELGLLKVKLNCESEYVDTWIITDNSYTTRRDAKDYALDQHWIEREVPHLADRILYNKIESRFAFKPGNQSYHQLLKSYHGEGTYFFVEQLQRLSGITRYIESKHFDLDSYVFVSDVDEMLVIKGDAEYKKFIDFLERNKPETLAIIRHKFLYDYDNITGMTRSVPLVSLRKTLGNLFEGLAQARIRGHLGLSSNEVYSIEFHNCLSIDGLLNKYNTYPHPYKIDKKQIIRALRMNIPIEHLGMPMGKVDLSSHKLTEDESNILPDYIKEMMDTIKLNSVSTNYLCHRLANGYDA